VLSCSIAVVFFLYTGKVRKSGKPVEKLIVPELMPDADCTANCSDAQRRGKLEKGLNTTFKSRLIVDGRNKFKSSSNSDKVKLPGIPTTFDSWTSLEKYYSLTQSKVADSSSDVLASRGVPAWWKHLYVETTAEKLFVCLFSRVCNTSFCISIKCTTYISIYDVMYSI